MADVKNKPHNITWTRPTLPEGVSSGFSDVTFDALYERTLGPFNPDYIPLRILNLMRKDAQIALGLWAIKAPIIGANYDVEGPDKNIAAFVKQQIEDHRYRFFKNALNALDFGFQAFGIEWKIANYYRYRFTSDTKKDGTKEMKWRSRRKCYVIDNLVDLDPAYVAMVYQKKTGVFRGIKYDPTDKYDLTTARTYSTEMIYLNVFNEEYSDKSGNALLYYAYNAWYFCNMCYLGAMRYLDGKGNPPYVGTAPSKGDVKITGEDQVRSPSDFMGELLYKLRSGGNIVFPNVRDEKGNALYSLEELKVTDRSELFIDYINHFQTMKLRSLLLPEQMLIQEKQTGSYAQASQHSETASILLDYIMHTFIASLNTYLVPKMVQYEFGATAAVPRIIPKGISKESEALYRSIIEKIIQAQSSKGYAMQEGEKRLSDIVDSVKILEQVNIPVDYQKLKKAAVVTTPEGIVQVEGIEDDNDAN